jgi:hypothetical protein
LFLEQLGRRRNALRTGNPWQLADFRQCPTGILVEEKERSERTFWNQNP